MYEKLFRLQNMLYLTSFQLKGDLKGMKWQIQDESSKAEETGIIKNNVIKEWKHKLEKAKNRQI